jgi:hypothetical protein
MVRRSIALGAGLLLAILLFAVLRTKPSLNRCQSPIFLALNNSILGNPTPQFAVIIQRAGGLPTAGAELNDNGLNFSSNTSISPVLSWRINALTVVDTTPILTRVLDDDPNYGIAVDIEVHYADGSTRVLRWMTWRYGLVLCPAVTPYGDGPPWRIKPID